VNSSISRMLCPLAATALALVTLTACGSEEPAEFASEGQQDVARDEQTQEEDPDAGNGRRAIAGEGTEADGAATEDGDTTPSADGGPAAGGVPGPEEAVEIITYELPDEDLEVTVGLHSLQVDGEVMRLDLSFTPDGRPNETYHINAMNRSSRMYPVLNDRENLKQYSLLRSSGTVWATDTSPFGTEVANGQTLMYYGYYAAPEDDIETLDIAVIDGLVEFTDAQIQW